MIYLLMTFNLCSECGIVRPVNRKKCPHCGQKSSVAPSKTQIAQACEEIKASWSADDERIRCCQREVAVEVTRARIVSDGMRRRGEKVD